jgi:hypothetical protein
VKKNVWVTSTRSGTNGQCVMGMRLDDGVTLVRDSKNPDGPELAFTAQEWQAFLHGVKNNEFD